MKIPLHMDQKANAATNAAQAKIQERDLLAAQRGDWNTKNTLTKSFLPLMTTLASKRTSDANQITRYVEAGKAGLLKAIKRYKPGTSSRFNIFVVEFIEKEMDKVETGGGLFARLFGFLK